MKLIWLSLIISMASLTLHGETWQEALAKMPLAKTNVTQLDRMACVPVMLNALQSNNVVKALIFMPGATDEFYMFKRAKAVFTNSSPTLLDAVEALTNQTFIRVTFSPPFLLLHSDEDPLDVLTDVKDEETAKKIRAGHFPPHGVYYDRDWNFLLPILRKATGASLLPRAHTIDSWHFYRHSFAEWNLTGWEGLQAVSLAGKTQFKVERKKVTFDADTRTRSRANVKDVRIQGDSK